MVRMAYQTAEDGDNGTEDSSEWWGGHRGHQRIVKMAQSTSEDGGDDTEIAEDGGDGPEVIRMVGMIQRTAMAEFASLLVCQGKNA